MNSNDQPHSHIRRLTLIAVPVIIIIIIAGFLLKAGGQFEMPLSEALNRHHHGVVGALGNVLYHAIGPAAAIVGTAVITGIIWAISRKWTLAATFAVTIAASWIPVAIVKAIVHRPRPVASLLSLPYHPIQVDASFPSGHMTFATAVVVTTVLMLAPGPRKRLVAIVGAIVVVLVGLLLAIDGVHYPTDVTASAIWVLAVTPLVYAVWVEKVLPWVIGKVSKKPQPLNTQ